MKIESHFMSADRYYFDFNECSYANGYCQIDTQQDASYYGNWINLTERKAVIYAEGDVSRISFDSDEEMVAWLNRFKDHEALGFIHIDPGLAPRYTDNVNHCKRLGIVRLLPEYERGSQ